MPLLKMKLSILITLILTAFWGITGFAANLAAEDDYDRLDGTGHSGKKVHVIEWEGNLEIHAYPSGSLKSLALKLDDRNPHKFVMVIGYRFKDQPDVQLIRRAILGTPFKSGFHAYRDATENEFDKIIISQQGLGSPLVAFQLEAEPTQLYPDGHPALAQASADVRTPASQQRKHSSEPKHAIDPDSGTIQPFFTSPGAL